MRRRFAASAMRTLSAATAVFVVACGSKAAPPPVTSSTTNAITGPSAADQEREREAREEQKKREEITASHRVAELEQQNAMAATCSEPKPWTKHERCLPSCYPTEEAAANADTKLSGPTEMEHIVCRRDGQVPFAVVDALDAKLAIKQVRGRFPKPHRKGSAEATLATWFVDSVKLAKHDVVVVKGAWRNHKHPLTRESLSCVRVAHYAKALRGKVGECGAGPGITCEAAGNGAARAINVVHFRLAEAKRLQAASKAEQCQQAALEAVAVARGLPRWRQYKKLNVDEWNDKLLYKTRFDGLLDEDTLFATVTALGAEAETLYAACGGATPTTNVDQEQSFHMCW
jgi:hypothetical protein